jgi:1-acyl-sn-glycerol-3-phosphate acyltransferase
MASHPLPAKSSFSFGWFDWFCLWYPPGWLILFNRHWQHYKPDPNGWRSLEYSLFLLPGGFYLALAIRRSRLAIKQFLHPAQTSLTPKISPDPAYQQAFRDEILQPIVQHYFRGTLSQLEHLPETAPLIIALNHTGMCFPWDFVTLAVLLGNQRNWNIQPLAHPLFFDHPWLKWWLPAGWAQALGGIRADRESFAAAIKPNATMRQNIVLCAPEGWRGIAKGWQKRYQLAAFDSSFVGLSLRDRVPIVPIVCLGSEYLHPWAINVKWLARRFNMPIFPLSPLMPIFILFPSMGIWAARSQLNYYIQPVWQPWQDIHPKKNLRQTVIHRLAISLRSRLQAILTQIRRDSC